MESVNFIVSLESKILTDNLDEAGPIMLSTALELIVKFVFSINVIMDVDGYLSTPNTVASDPFSCFIIISSSRNCIFNQKVII